MNAEQAEAKFREAAQLFKDGELEKALTLLNVLRAAFPNEPKLEQAYTQIQRGLDKRRREHSVPAKPTRPSSVIQWRLAIGGALILLLVIVAVVGYMSGRSSEITSHDSSGLVGDQLGANTASRADPKSEEVRRAETNSYTPTPEPVPLDSPLPAVQPITVKEPLYPDGKMTVYVPAAAERERYLRSTIFKLTVLSKLPSSSIRLAEPSDVTEAGLGLTGYRTSKYPPKYVPEIEYPSGDSPVFPFVGQKIPGLDEWLVDVASVDGKSVTVPAVTTIDFRDFRSINWPRERYLSAILAVNSGRADFHLAGGSWEFRGFRDFASTLSGICDVTGDLMFGGGLVQNVEPGTIFVIASKHDSTGTGFGDRYEHGTVEMFADAKFHCEGTQNRPIIFTSADASSNAPHQWYGIQNNNSVFELSHALFEHALFAVRQELKGEIKNCCFRYSCDPAGADGVEVYPIFDCSPDSRFIACEFHDALGSIHAAGSAGTMYFEDNVVYTLQSAPLVKGFFGGGGDYQHQVIANNTVWKAAWGIALEDNTRPETIALNNVVLCCRTIGYHTAHALYTSIGQRASDPTIVRSMTFANNSNVRWFDPKDGNNWPIDRYDRENLFDQDPIFINPHISDFRVGNQSPAVGSGTREYSKGTAHAVAPSVDFYGKRRGENPTIGAFEPYPEP